jgi:hypothetical protein
MKKYNFLVLVLALVSGSVWAQDRIYRCGNEYTNTLPENQAQNCKLISGGSVTVVPGRKQPSAGGGVKPVSTTTPPGTKVDAGEQRAKDSDARLILEAELKKAEARQLELQKEYNNGEPEKQGGEARNYQKYLDRVADLKAALARNESDIAGIRRELGRLPGGASALTSAR